MAILIIIPYSIFMYIVDPYVLVGNQQKGKVLPNYHIYSYNFFKKYSKLDYAFLGSSVVNYYDINYMYGNTSHTYSMGIESSTIGEQIAFGKVLASKHPKEITFFLSFYSFNPSRAPENYFNRFVVNSNNIAFDFIYQYICKQAYLDAIYWIYSGRHNTDWVPQFNFNGTRTQNHYLLDKSYIFDEKLADYLALNYTDKRLYGSKTFKEPSSIDDGIEKIKDFKDYLEVRNIKLNLVIAPDHRMIPTMIYYMGLGNTYEHLRKGLASIQPFYDLNLDTAFTSKDENYWDAHHVRNGRHVIDDLRSNKFLLKQNKLEEAFLTLKPTEGELAKLKQIFKTYKNWTRARKISDDDIKLTPLVAE